MLEWARTTFEGLLEYMAGLSGYGNRQNTDWELRELLGDRGHDEVDGVVGWRLPHWVTYLPGTILTADRREHLSRSGANIREAPGGWVVQLGSLNGSYGSLAHHLQEWWLANWCSTSPSVLEDGSS